ncbi:MAG: FGGY-family carbohydrate kinase [Pseudomonadota bacterium]
MTSVLAVDLGGSGLKAALVTADGRIGALRRVPIALEAKPSGACEADPETWWQALLTALDGLQGDGADLDGVSAVAICGFTRTQVFLDADLRVVRPAIAFTDSRPCSAFDQRLARAEDFDPALLPHLTPFHPLSRLVWVMHNEPEAWNETRTILEPKDYLNLKLTGMACSDPVSQHWLTGAFTEDSDGSCLAARFGIDRDVRPEMRQPVDAVGSIRPGLAGALSRLAGRPVFCGSNDAWTGAVAIGALGHRRGYNISGTSEVFGLVADRPAEAEGLISMQWADGLWQLGGPSQGGASVLSWAIDRFRPDADAGTLLECLVSVSRRPPVFLPYLNGERTPFWERDLRAAFVGLHADHDTGDMIRAAAESVCFLNRLVLDRAETALGLSATEIRFAGGAAGNPAWAQLKADVLNRPVIVSAVPEAGLIGGLLVALSGLAGDAALGDRADRLCAERARFEPDAGRRGALEERYHLFLQAHAALPAVSAGVAAHVRAGFPEAR